MVTKGDLVRGFKEIGIVEGMLIEVHSSLKSFGYVVGGAQSVVDALIEVIGYDGTIVMPLQSGNNNEPSYWCRPPLDINLWKEQRDNMPSFNPRESDCGGMGRIADNFRRRQGAYFSYHPASAFVAYGKYAKLICNQHELSYSLSETSPLGTMMRLNPYVLLLGVGYDNCTGMHLAEYESGVRPVVMQGGSIEEGGVRKWVKYLDIELDSDDFVESGFIMEQKKLVNKQRIGKCDCKFFQLKPAIDITRQYLQKKYG